MFNEYTSLTNNNKNRDYSRWIIDDLKKSGLTLNDLTVFPLENELQLKQILGFTQINGTSIEEIGGYFIKYPNVDNYYRLKLKEPIGSCKYLSPSKDMGLGNHPYISNEVLEIAKRYDPDKALIFTEGEKKAVSATKNGFYAIGLPGIWNFKDSECDLLPELNELNLKYRKIFIIFDSDIISKHNVKLAELRLFVELTNRGANVFSVRLTEKEKGFKIGLDDFLVEHGSEELDKLIKQARPVITTHLTEGIETDLLIEEISKLKSKTRQEEIISEIAKARNVRTDTLRKSISSLSKKLEINVVDQEDNFTDEEKEEARSLLKDPDLKFRILDQIEKSGYVGEKINKLLLYLAFTSRLFDESISCVVKGDSSSGKSSLVKSVLQLFPKSEYHEYTSVTQQSLYYLKSKKLSHKILVILEANGSEKADYPIRSSLSEGFLKILATKKNPVSGSFEAEEIKIPAEGLSFCETTTKSSINPENETRLFSLYMDMSIEQTRNVLIAKSLIFDKEKIENQNRVFRALQQLLEPYEVIIPYSEYLVDKFPVNKVRARRDFPRLLTLIRTSCLLHQFQRQKVNYQSKKILVADPNDYKIAYEIAQEVLSQTLKDMTPRQEKIIGIIEKTFNKEYFSISDLHNIQEIRKIAAYSTLKNDIYDLRKAGFIEWNGEKGNNSKYNLVNKLEEILKLPDPEEIAEKYQSLLAQSDISQELQEVTNNNQAIAKNSWYSPKSINR